VLIGRPAPDHARWHLVPLLTVLAGCAASTFFLYVMFTKMESRCLWCLCAHVINYLLLVGTILLWPRKGKPAPVMIEDQPDTVEATAVSEDATEGPMNEGPVPVGEAPAPHPSRRLVVATLACAFALMYAEFAVAVRDQSRHMNKLLGARLKTIFEDTLTQLAQYKGRPALQVPLRPSDPRRIASEEVKPISHLVVFSDFECPACKRLAQELEKSIVPAFDHALEIVWKHLPSCTDCNPKAVKNIHPSACEAAYAAEAARLQGGNEAFWRAHDTLFAARAELARLQALRERMARAFRSDFESQ